MKMLRKLSALLVVLATLLSVCATLISCGGDGTVIDNETTRLVLSISELDGVFNPFYSSSGPDGTIVGMTQIGMLSSDKDGQVAYGEDEACVVLDYQPKFITDDDGNILQTVYYFVLKNDVKFSNGSALTIKDVLFNLYVYLDPTYYGSATIYSTKIIGLQEYRTQSRNEKEQESFDEQFADLAEDRVDRLLECYEMVKEANPNKSLSDEQMIAQLTIAMNECIAIGGDIYNTVVDDYELVKQYFLDELEYDYTSSKGTAQDIVYTANGQKITLTTDTEAFLYNEGFITWDEKKLCYKYTLGEDSKYWTEQQAIDALYTSFIPNDLVSVLYSWNTAIEIRDYFAYLEKENYFNSLDPEDKITSIEGIKFANRTESVTVNDVVYDAPVYDANGNLISGHEILSIAIEEVDPKAIWNFAFSVAPMYYYSNEEQIEAFNYTDSFGVKFGSITFQDEVIKKKDKIGVPVGAGPYKATNIKGDGLNITAGTFRDGNIVRFQRNDYFMFDVKIKYINYKVTSTNLMLESLFSGEVHFVEPACKDDNIKAIEAKASEGFASNAVRTNGYGYIGINASKVPDLAVRQAIMHAINTQYAVDYYLGYSDKITRPMTKASWAYPDEADEAGQYYAFDITGAKSEQLVIDAGYTKNDMGVYQKDGHTLKYTFTIAGDTTDHPAYQSLKIAADILNERGFDITVTTDINALKKLNRGDLTVWAAAWGAGVDPDMYQVYHMDSTAGSTENWGYGAIKNNTDKYATEYDIIKDLSNIIDLARQTLDTDKRADYYAQALDLVMELAVELPTYQRSDLFAYNTNIIDVNSLTPESELTPYNGPMSKIWEVSLNETGK